MPARPAVTAAPRPPAGPEAARPAPDDDPRADPRRRRRRPDRRRRPPRRQEVTKILDDPVGRHALDRLLITPETVREHPDLLQSFAAYISPDGKRARIDVTPGERLNSEAAMDQVVTCAAGSTNTSRESTG